MTAIPNEVRRTRRARGWTQAQLAERVGVTRQNIIAIEQGVTPGLTTALRLRRALGTDVATLFPAHAAMADGIPETKS